MDLQAIAFVSDEYFKSVVLPPLRRWPANKNKLWGSGISEEKAFKPLSNVIDTVIPEASKAGDTPAKLGFASRPMALPLSMQSNATRPDADKNNQAKYFDSDSWDDVVVSFEFKKSEGDAERKDYDKRVIWSLHHITRSDPCRRTTFGFTTEHTQMKCWFTCRAATLVSKPFDFIMEAEHATHFFCCLAFANDYELDWVRRDVSAANVLRGGSMGKLAAIPVPSSKW
ncbi:hypothetical protein EV401DRAFT_2083030 [Pisolithus croceorrhizus]|nr:hypothetical protein EV401DRAFT_2083030 [Pisolithus croceorrhizus]